MHNIVLSSVARSATVAPATGGARSVGAALLALMLLSFPAGCARQIGDDCTTNVNCSALGDRVCDLASPGGYCTVESCDRASCPDDAVCVRFYTLQRASLGCNFDRAQTATVRASCAPGDTSCCQPGDGTCCRAGELCLCAGPLDEAGRCPALAYCAPASTERRYCMKSCEQDAECRDGYRCLSTGGPGCVRTCTGTSCSVSCPGASGAIPVPYRDEDGVAHDWSTPEAQVRYCAPTPAN